MEWVFYVQLLGPSVSRNDESDRLAIRVLYLNRRK